ncbi:hypothetical protein AGABI2DRAFT_68342 [Agaricus bisporus var. bisporus H97]|uniref:hypothetical protein n=1 Tax=Agaricus bisporus var. bisporus (strain H97 / ATCC MYA-4626 / FGSC 10389) TaxID=936046 RepID=UPI00029F522D|nr:hypothetical protein AGABI2DRAFT_68342 [Agaricus bisporus var. bisporus H97]EKV48652.1 hypothetical protein AGABI2DRAFT_68342 [Agaricus bisporus var. bisporus H97]
MKKPNISVNLDLFQDPDTPGFPKSLDSWKTALVEVKADIVRVIDHPNANVFRGFAFPPRGIFRGSDEQKNLEHMLAWLVVRPSWMDTLGDSLRSGALPNAQQWRTFLRGVALELELVRVDNRQQTSEAPATAISTSHSRRRGSKLKEAARDIFPQDLPKKEDMRMLVWNDHVVWRRTGGLGFSAIDSQHLIWDTEEHNFRAELITLDRLIMQCMWATDEGNKIRSKKLDAMWPDGGVSIISLPNESIGVAAEDWIKRCPFVEAFQNIVMDWPGDVPRLLTQHSFSSNVNGQVYWHRLMMEKVERLAAGHYCQAFFDHFGRAPSIPRIFPVG